MTVGMLGLSFMVLYIHINHQAENLHTVTEGVNISFKGMYGGGHVCLSFMVLYIHINHQAENLHTDCHRRRQHLL